MRSDLEIEAMLKSANLVPSESLKEEILEKAKRVSPNCKKTAQRQFFAPKRLTALAASLLLISVLIFGGVWHENYESIYLDVNPSVELVLNRFDTVHTVVYHNEEAKALFSGLAFQGQSVDSAVTTLLDTLNEADYLNDHAEVYLTATCKKAEKAEKLLGKVLKKAEEHANTKGYRISFTAQTLTKEEREALKAVDISPAKYRLIQSIIALDDSYTVEELSQMKMKDLHRLEKELSQKD